MRRYDKKGHMKRVNLLFEQRVFIENDILLEIESLDYTSSSGKYEDSENLSYKFNASGIPYTVSIWHDTTKHHFGVYEVQFYTSEQKHSGDRTGLDLKHLNKVIYTVFNIVETAVKKYKIQKVKLEGARDEKDSSDAYFKGSIRSKLYLRFINNRYPQEAVESIGPWINIDMTKVFPEIYASEENNVDNLVNTLLAISDGDPNRNYIIKGLDGSSEENISYGGELENNKYGLTLIEISNDPSYGFDINWDMYDSEGEGEIRNIKTLPEVIEFLKNKFL